MTRERLTRLITHLTVIVAIALMGLYVFAQHYRVAINVTPSLPGHVYLIDLNDKTPKKEGFIAFKAQGMAPLPEGVTVIKVVKGLAGDVVSVIDRAVYVNGTLVALAKTHSQSGLPLSPIASQVIGEGQLYVWASHPDSFDSRYATPGLIDEKQIIGTARELF